MPYKDPEKRKAYARKKSKEWALANPERRKLSKKAWYKANPEKTKAQSKRDSLKQLGWSFERFEMAKGLQFGRCAICKCIPEGKAQAGVLCADHSHTNPPTPRALLCMNCNIVLGHAKDNPEVLDSAASYLRNWSKEHELHD